MEELIKQHLEIKKNHPDRILLIGGGDWYHSFYEDADACGRILGITVSNVTDAHIHYSGFPNNMLDNYLSRLIRAGKRVAIADVLEKPKTEKKKSLAQAIKDYLKH